MKEHALAAAMHADVAVVHLDRSRGFPRAVRVNSEELPTWRVSYRSTPTPLSMALHLVAAGRGWRAVRASGFEPDVIHAHFFLAGVPAVLLGRRRIPVLVTEQWSIFLPSDPAQLSRTLRRVASFAYRHANRVLPASDALRRGIEAEGIEAAFTVVPNVVDTGLFAGDGSRRNGRLLAVGLLYEAKGYEFLLEAIALLARQGRDVWLDVVGDGPGREPYERLAAELGVDDRVLFHGLLPKQEVARMMREAELFVLTSRYDNNPCVVIEAMASGLPIVATAVGGIPEMVDERSGRLARAQDPESIAAEIAAAIDGIDGYDREAIADAARRRYGRDTVGNVLAALYADAVARRR